MNEGPGGAGDIYGPSCNGDQKITASDTQFANLKVWRDLNSDGVSQANELSTLNTLGITAFDTTTRQAVNTTQPNGNLVEETFTYAKTDGSTGTVGEVWFRESTFVREFTDTIPISAAAAVLPELAGTGTVRDLREAM